jgi:microcystin-dependent protein
MPTFSEIPRKQIIQFRFCLSRSASRILLAAFLVTYGGLATAATPVHPEGPPELISYQGTLNLASDGVTPVNGTENIVFRLYPQSDSPLGDAVWGEIHKDVPITNGVFNVYLGGGKSMNGLSHESLASQFTQGRHWLGLQVGLDPEMIDRQRISSVPYAHVVEHANTAFHGVPAGTMVMYAGASPPQGWLFCKGQQLNASTDVSFTRLYEAIGNNFGGTDDTNFQLPNMDGRTPIAHKGAGGLPNTDLRSGTDVLLRAGALDTKFGVETVTLSIPEMPVHKHQFKDKYLHDRTFYGRTDPVAFGVDIASPPTGHPTVTEPTGGGSPHNNMQPSVYINFIIKQ